MNHITTHDADALARLISQYSDKIRIRGFISSFTPQIQQLEDIFWDIYTISDIDISVGAQLDGMGANLGLQRLGLTDAQFRVVIRTQIALLSDHGTPEEMIAAFKTLMGASSVFYLPAYPAAFIMTASAAAPLLPTQEIKRLMTQIVPAGVGFFFVSSPTDYFGFFDDPDADTFGDYYAPSTGGTFSTII